MAVDISKYIDLNIFNTLSLEDQQELSVLYDPSEWAKDRLGWESRDYQREFLDKLLDNKQIVLRWGRRLGKSDNMAVSAIYFADTQYNIDENKGSYKVLIICPYESQVDEIFDRIKVLLENSKLYDSVQCHHHKITFANGSKIMGKTAGSKSNTGAASLRGQGADVIILDEVDYMNDKDIMNIMQLKKEAPDRIKFITASTPTGDRKLFYKWCTEAENLGWTHIHRTSLVSPQIHDINPDNKLGLTYLEELKQQLTELEFLHEVMAEFAENQKSLFQKRFLDIAIKKGRDLKWTYYDRTKEIPLKRGPRILGCDWDKAAASTNMVVIEYNKNQNQFYVIDRVEIPSHEFTYTVAVDTIIELNDVYDLDWIYVDRGYGETQIELLKQYGISNPHTGLTKKVIGIQLGQKIDIRDPHTKKKISKDVKPYMVNNAVNVFEKESIVLNPSDWKTIKQLQDYAIKSIGNSGRPIYTSGEEHIVDCVGLALLGFEQQYGAMFNIAISAKVLGLSKSIDAEEVREEDIKQQPRIISMMGKKLTQDHQEVDLNRPQPYISKIAVKRYPQPSYSRRKF